jgi:hypothetical protein
MKMPSRRFTKQTELAAVRLLEEAMAYFGPEGLGLQVVKHSVRTVRFVGGGGQIRVELFTTEDGNATRIEIRTGEWAYHVRKFLEEIQS